MTTVLGAMPLIVAPGAGSELYRGIGSVLVGGLVVSTLFTLVVVPALLGLMMDLRRRLGHGRARSVPPVDTTHV
jgi:HAE1 family hydrophobic/amphiphilic exporter-1